ncbi:MAG: mechanosensitive ion channel domain-containing protein [Pseudomonadota bacterium]
MIRLLAVLASVMLLGSTIAPIAQTALGIPGSEPAAAAPDPALEALIEALEDPDARARLVEALRDGNATLGQTDPAADADAPPTTLAARVAQKTQQVVDNLLSGTSVAVRDASQLTRIPDLLTAERIDRIARESLALFLTIAATVFIYRLLRGLSRRIQYQGDRSDGFWNQATIFAAQMVLRVLSVLLAWLIGYGLAGSVFAQDSILLSQALYLNAFLIFGAFSVMLSVFVSHHPADLTFSNLPLAAEATIYRTIRRTFGFLCYGIVAVVPITQDWFNFVAARSVRSIVITLSAITALYAVYRIAKILRNEREILAGAVPDEDSDTENKLTETIATHSIGLWDRVWPFLGYGYVLVSFSVAMARPNLIVELVGRATVFTALGLVILLLGLRVFAQAGKGHEAPVPKPLAQAFPTLRQRLSAFVPLTIVVSGLALVVLAVTLTLEGWRLIDLATWLSTGGTDFLWRIASIVLIVGSLVAGWAGLSAWIDNRLSANDPARQVSARSRTLLALFRNALTISLVIFGGMAALSELGIDIAPLLAGAGVIGLAIGFGAQKLVQDIITGIFIQLENAINEGDVITVAGVTGGVEKLTIRSVGLRDLAGVYHLIPFSAVDTVANFMRSFAYHVEVVGVAYESDLDAAERAMNEAFDKVKSGPLGRDIIAPLEWHGVVGLGDSSVNLRARLKTRPGEQWAVGRAYTEEVKYALDRAGVEIPYPHRELRLPKDMLGRLGAAPETSTADPEP